ncbi:MAG: hypothetical protein KDF65_00025 [Anaerolineae bacterium]|nr:hypothetical protein [Anaerolineae bacterium]
MSTSLQKIKVTTVMVAVALSVLTGCGVARPETSQPAQKAPAAAQQETTQDTGAAAEPVKPQAEPAQNTQPETTTEESQAQPEAARPTQPGLQANDEWIEAEEDIWLPVVDGLEQHLQLARQHFEANDVSGAAAEIRAAATFLADESGPVTDPASQEILQKAGTQLETLASKVADGKVTSIEGLNPIFREAFQTDVDQRISRLSAEERAILAGQPGQHFQQAVTALSQNEPQTAATELQKGIAFAKIEASPATGMAKDSLTTALADLEAMAGQLRNGETIDNQTLGRLLARTHHALASHHLARSTEAQANNNLKDVGYELKTAAIQLELALTQAGQGAEGHASGRLQALNSLADQLIEGNAPEMSQITQVIDSVEQELAKLDQLLTSQESEAAFGEALQPVDAWIAVDEDTWLPVVDRMTDQMQLAHQAFMDHDNKMAAKHIRQSAGFFREETANLSASAGKTAFEQTAVDLEKLADQVEQGQIKKISELNGILLQAYDTDVEFRLTPASSEVYSPLVEWPVSHLGQALAAFDKGETEQAAEQIFKAISFLRVEETRATGVVRQALTNSINDLEQVGRDLREGHPASREALDKAFVRAYQALGNHHYLRAEEAMTNEDLVSAGHELQATAKTLEPRLSEADRAFITDLHKLADDLMAGSPLTTADIAQAMKATGQQLEKLGQMTASESGRIKTSDEWVVADGDFFVPVINELGQHLKVARESFLAKDYPTTATEIRAAAQILQEEEVKPEAKSVVEAQSTAGQALLDLADKVEQGQEVSEVRQLDTVFAQAYEADTEQRIVHATTEEMSAFVDKVGEHFDQAINALQSQDNQRAAAEIRKASAFINLDAVRASEPAKTALQTAMADLNAVAVQLEDNQALTATELEMAFAQAHHALANYHQARAVEAQANNDPIELGYELKTTASHLQQALARAGRTLEEDRAQLITDLNTLADQLINVQKTQPGQIDQMFESLGQQLEQVGQELETTTHAPGN